MSPENLSAAARLCASCGLCCNGVLFHSVALQPLDDPKALLSLGLKLKKKRKQVFIIQPCPAHKDSCCSIYDARPQRCRLFACRQLELVRAGGISEAEAMEKISTAKALVEVLDDLLCRAGSPNRRRSLRRRQQKVLDEPLDAPGGEVLRGQLAAAMTQLEEVLASDFRVN